MGTGKVKIYGARVRVDSMSKVAEIEEAEKEKMKEKINKIIAHEELFADVGILAIEQADLDVIERLALVPDGEIASSFDNPESVKLGLCGLIKEIIIGEDILIKFSGVAMGQACTIVLRGASHHILDEAERSLHDAVCVLSQTVNDSRLLLGGRWPEMEKVSCNGGGIFPTTITDNAGLDSAELISQLRDEHQNEDVLLELMSSLQSSVSDHCIHAG
ncbi:T-complex protein 1 subunit beta [Medicago truncatula]|uniref:T-complex protein 1 subunit beta n=1 Tax=Medicago truncatula TaxID=3880 RepID=UPI0019689E06|nr:T-complex protein 1 subunit beta-like [Medicago truncatula]